VAIAIFYWVNSLLTPRLTLPMPTSTDVGATLWFIIASYLVGTVVQAIGEYTEGLLFKLAWWKSNPIVELFSGGDSQFPAALQKKLKGYILETFDLELSPQPCSDNGGQQLKTHGKKLIGGTDKSSDKEQRKKAWEAVALCYSLIIQAKMAQRAERIKAFFRLFRGIFVTSVIAWPLTIVVLLVIPKSDLGWPVILLSVSIVVSGFLFFKFAVLFPIYALEDFYTWHELKRTA
jgi:hypothetical protein